MRHIRALVGHRGKPARVLAAGLAVAGLTGALAGCGASAAPVALPKKPSSVHVADAPPASVLRKVRLGINVHIPERRGFVTARLQR